MKKRPAVRTDDAKQMAERQRMSLYASGKLASGCFPALAYPKQKKTGRSFFSYRV